MRNAVPAGTEMVKPSLVTPCTRAWHVHLGVSEFHGSLRMVTCWPGCSVVRASDAAITDS